MPQHAPNDFLARKPRLPCPARRSCSLCVRCDRISWAGSTDGQGSDRLLPVDSGWIIAGQFGDERQTMPSTLYRFVLPLLLLAPVAPASGEQVVRVKDGDSIVIDSARTPRGCASCGYRRAGVSPTPWRGSSGGAASLGRRQGSQTATGRRRRLPAHRRPCVRRGCPCQRRNGAARFGLGSARLRPRGASRATGRRSARRSSRPVGGCRTNVALGLA